MPIRPLSIETLFAVPRLSRAQISYVAPWRGRLKIFVHEAGSAEEPSQYLDRRLTEDETLTIEDFVWRETSAPRLRT